MNRMKERKIVHLPLVPLVQILDRLWMFNQKRIDEKPFHIITECVCSIKCVSGIRPRRRFQALSHQSQFTGLSAYKKEARAHVVRLVLPLGLKIHQRPDNARPFLAIVAAHL